MAGAAGAVESTVARGLRELERGEESDGRVRAVGAGRKRLRDLHPELIPDLLALVEPDERGDPESPLRWTVKSTRALAAELTQQGRRVGHDTVAALLKAEGFSLQATSRTTEGAATLTVTPSSATSTTRSRHAVADGQPVISVDAKKKETLGRYAVIGREWHRAGNPVEVRAHDFPEKGALKAVPYGIYAVVAVRNLRIFGRVSANWRTTLRRVCLRALTNEMRSGSMPLLWASCMTPPVGQWCTAVDWTLPRRSLMADHGGVDG
ncbi:hypothetical protein [Streptomyces sp. NPDC058694]|uniref:ISAzo13-like element transposase-related protein n=1 Tax=Streptomyces sp. NPDC058694 TaxID=3346603 RepID=UPI00364C861D